MSMDPPPPTCDDCGADVTDLDGDWNACLYTGGACPPGGCDCGRPTYVLCREHREQEAMDTPTINVPVPFTGTPEERANNRDSHHFVTDNGEDYNCLGCDCKPWHVAANYPCGDDVPRHDVPTESIGCAS